MGRGVIKKENDDEEIMSETDTGTHSPAEFNEAQKTTSLQKAVSCSINDKMD